MEQIERLINKTLKFFFVHNEGQHIRRDPIIRGNDYRVNPTKSNKLLNSNNLFQNLETSELQSIPTEVKEEEDEKMRMIMLLKNSIVLKVGVLELTVNLIVNHLFLLNLNQANQVILLLHLLLIQKLILILILIL